LKMAGVLGSFKDMQATAGELVEKIHAHGIDGVGGLLKGSTQLASEYADHKGYRTAAERVEALIKWQAAHSFGAGFVTGLGGLATLPVSVPASLYASLVLNTRMSAAIAELHGHSPKSDQIRAGTTLTLLGKKFIGDTLRDSGVHVTKKVAVNTIGLIPGTTLRAINRQVGFRLLTKAGQTGVVNLTKIVPVLGGVVGGTLEAAYCVYTGRVAAKYFAPGEGLDLEESDNESEQ
jgi:uncharacterized protein (DUF697 family)